MEYKILLKVKHIHQKIIPILTLMIISTFIIQTKAFGSRNSLVNY